MPMKDHAVRMADFALGMLECAEVAGMRTGVKLRMRVGFHSGGVVAGVIRADKGRFQLFGDTVNTASRMESTGVPTKIQVSAASAALLEAAGTHVLEYRGKVAAKGKGEVDTYWVSYLFNGFRCSSQQLEIARVTPCRAGDCAVRGLGVVRTCGGSTGQGSPLVLSVHPFLTRALCFSFTLCPCAQLVGRGDDREDGTVSTATSSEVDDSCVTFDVVDAMLAARELQEMVRGAPPLPPVV